MVDFVCYASLLISLVALVVSTYAWRSRTKIVVGPAGPPGPQGMTRLP